MTTLYRADAHGLTEVAGLTSWTSAREHAEEYASGALVGFGGPCVYRIEVAETAPVLDLRADHRSGLADLVDVDDYPHTRMRDLLRDIANVLRAHGYVWVAFHDRQDRPHQDFDEWLYLGDPALPVSPVPTAE